MRNPPPISARYWATRCAPRPDPCSTTASVKSALQRARARLKALAPAADQISEPTAPQARVLLDQYIAAFGNADAAALERLLVHDATLEATPLRTWFAGLET